MLRLRDPRHPVHRKSILWWTLRTSIFWLVVILGQTAGEVFASQPPGWLKVTLTISIVLGVLQGVIEPQWRYRVHRWEANQEAVVTRSGWISPSASRNLILDVLMSGNSGWSWASTSPIPNWPRADCSLMRCLSLAA